MPELPEVETIRRNLEPHLRGKRVVSVSDATHPRTLRYQENGIDELRKHLVNRQITAVVRRGKFLWLVLGDEVSAESDVMLVIHLGMSGQLRLVASHDAPLRHERLRCILDDDEALVFCDQRTFGHLELRPTQPTLDHLPGGCGSDLPLMPAGLEHIARDVLDPYRDPEVFIQKALRSNRAIKTKLLDQTCISGIGNIYADEGLFAAGIHPAVACSRLDSRKLAEVVDSVRKTMEHALDFGGTSFDRLYVNSWGNPGEFSRELMVYGRSGRECRRCGATLAKMVIDQRSSVYCPHCQLQPY